MDKIICVGKNYLKHAKELGDAVPEYPLLFIKPPSSLVRMENSQVIKLPRGKGEVHHELELVFKIRRDNMANEISITAWTLGLDLTLRDLQTQLKKDGHPWERAKAFPQSAIVGEFVHLDPGPQSVGEKELNETFELVVNGKVRQRGQGKDMRWKPDFLLKEAAEAFYVADGDLLFTGTPEGVGPLNPGDKLTLKLGNLLEYNLKVE